VHCKSGIDLKVQGRGKETSCRVVFCHLEGKEEWSSFDWNQAKPLSRGNRGGGGGATDNLSLVGRARKRLRMAESGNRRHWAPLSTLSEEEGSHFAVWGRISSATGFKKGKEPNTWDVWFWRSRKGGTRKLIKKTFVGRGTGLKRVFWRMGDVFPLMGMWEHWGVVTSAAGPCFSTSADE